MEETKLKELLGSVTPNKQKVKLPNTLLSKLDEVEKGTRAEWVRKKVRELMDDNPGRRCTAVFELDQINLRHGFILRDTIKPLMVALEDPFRPTRIFSAKALGRYQACRDLRSRVFKALLVAIEDHDIRSSATAAESVRKLMETHHK